VNLRKKTEVWRYINKKRGRKMFKENNIEEEEWKRHFEELLGVEMEESERSEDEGGNRENEEGSFKKRKLG